MQRLAAICALLLGLVLAAPPGFAQVVAPDTMLRAVSEEVIDSVKNDREYPEVDPATIATLVQSRILPLFDFDRMTQLAVARNWNLATPEQQIQITSEFKSMLVRTYSAALLRYRGEPIVFRQLRTEPQGGEVTVRSEVKQPGNKRTTMDYEMAKTPAGWKIYNVKVADVCLVSTYRDLFAKQVRDGGVEGLIKFLADENRGSGFRFDTAGSSFWEKSRVLYAILQDALRRGLR